MCRTSLAQMYFFAWTMERGNLTFIMDHVHDIKRHMRATLNARRMEGRSKKRQKLCAKDKGNTFAASASMSGVFKLT